jgi:phosphotransferase system HPr (HPr) family protein
MSNAASQRSVIVRNPQGLHARPAHSLVRLASRSQSVVMIGKAGEWADCRSILSLLTLGATQGTELVVSAEGDDSDAVLQEIAELFEAGFDELNEIDATAKPGVEP